MSEASDYYITIAAIRQDMAALLHRPAGATQAEVQALMKMAERDKTIVANIDGEKVVALLTGQVENHVSGFQATYREFLEGLVAGTQKLNLMLTERILKLEAATLETEKVTAKAYKATVDGTAITNAALDRFSQGVRVDWFYQKWWAIGLFMAAILLVNGAQFAVQSYKRVPQADFEAEVKLNKSKEETNRVLYAKASFYFTQIERFKKANPAKRGSFPVYEPSADTLLVR